MFKLSGTNNTHVHSYICICKYDWALERIASVILSILMIIMKQRLVWRDSETSNLLSRKYCCDSKLYFTVIDKIGIQPFTSDLYQLQVI